MKSICLLVQNYYDLDVRVRRKAEALCAAGYSWSVLRLRSLPQPKSYTLEGVNVRAISIAKRRGSLARYGFEYLTFFIWATLRLTVQMMRKRYALIDINTLPDFLIFAGLFSRWMGAKLILDMHEITPEFYMSKYRMGERSSVVRILKFIERASFDFADHVITINEPIQDLLKSRGLPQRKSTVITNGADELHFTNNHKPGAPADTAAASKFVMMYHGTLTKLYGLDIAIDAFATVHKEMPGAELWILGTGTEAAALRAQTEILRLEDKVKFLGMIPPTEIPGWLARCHIGILPIRHDVFLEYASPNKLAEYIIMDKAVVVSRLRAVQYYFSENALAFCEPNNPADLAKQMMRMYQNPGLCKRFSTTATEEYMPIRWSVTRERYLNLVRDLAGGKEQPVERSDTALASG